jgi:hypothetical protein
MRILLWLVAARAAYASPSPCFTFPPGPDDLADLFIATNYSRAHPLGGAVCLHPRTHPHLLELFERPAGVVLAYGPQVQLCARCGPIVPERDWPVPFETQVAVAREMYIPLSSARLRSADHVDHAKLVVHWTTHPLWPMNSFRVTPTWSELVRAARHVRGGGAYVDVIIYASTGSRDQDKLRAWMSHADKNCRHGLKTDPRVRLRVVFGSDEETHSEEVFRSMVEADGLVVMGPNPVSWWAAALNQGQVWVVGTDELGMRLPGYFTMEGGEEERVYVHEDVTSIQ